MPCLGGCDLCYTFTLLTVGFGIEAWKEILHVFGPKTCSASLLISLWFEGMVVLRPSMFNAILFNPGEHRHAGRQGRDLAILCRREDRCISSWSEIGKKIGDTEKRGLRFTMIYHDTHFPRNPAVSLHVRFHVLCFRAPGCLLSTSLLVNWLSPQRQPYIHE